LGDFVEVRAGFDVLETGWRRWGDFFFLFVFAHIFFE
jgi:hypothetical protein